MSKKRFKGQAEKREPGSYVALPHAVLRSEEFKGLSALACKLLLSLLTQYVGDNNGDLCAAWTVMKGVYGWRSKDSLAKALNELQETGFIIKTRQGGRHRASLYAVTWFEIDFCKGKLDLQAPTKRFMGLWKSARASDRPSKKVPRPTGQLSTDCPARRGNSSSPSAVVPRPPGLSDGTAGFRCPARRAPSRETT